MTKKNPMPPHLLLCWTSNIFKALGWDLISDVFFSDFNSPKECSKVPPPQLSLFLTKKCSWMGWGFGIKFYAVFLFA